GLTAWGFIWAIYGFAIRPLPGGVFWDDLFWQLQYLERTHAVYLNGEISESGWWYYFPIAFIYKVPLPTLGLMLFALGHSLIQRRWLNAFQQTDWLFFLIPALVYLGFAQLIANNIGYRYLINAFPFLMLLVGAGLADDKSSSQPQSRPLMAGLAAVLATAVLCTTIWPNYISHFNWLAGGQQGGWRILSDSNVDWGQDLVALREWQIETGQPIKLSYFGTAYPSGYGLNFEPMPMWSAGAEQQRPDRQTYYPSNPAPGTYAISVTNLHGAVLEDQARTYAYFREKEPIYRAGNSIFVYQVDPTNEPVYVSFSGVVPADMPSELHNHFETNDVQIRWFDLETSFIWPVADQPGDRFFVTDRPMPENSRFDYQLINQLDGVYLYTAALKADSPLFSISEGAEMGVATFGGIRLNSGCENALDLSTEWRVSEPTTRQLKIFVHALNEAGDIIGQSDILTVDSNAWQTGDWLTQQHQIFVDGAVATFRVGLYNAGSGERMGEPVIVTNLCQSQN
ncbi:MAG: hypothetical protein AAGD96_36140, partial [Chloroflexota bacterium]